MSEHESESDQSAEPVQDGVLVAVDFSDGSKAAAIWACHYAEATRQPLVLLHVVHDPASDPGFYYDESTREMRPLHEVAEQMMKEFLAALDDECPGCNSLTQATRYLVPGLPRTRIIEVAGLLDAAIVVVGSKGRSNLGKILLGSVAERVVRLSTKPVVVVKPENSEPHKKELKKQKKRLKKDQKRLKKMLGMDEQKQSEDAN